MRIINNILKKIINSIHLWISDLHISLLLCYFYIKFWNQNTFFYSLQKIYLESENIAALEKITTIWESLSKVESKAVRSKHLCAAVLNHLFKDIISEEIKESTSLFLLKMCRGFVGSKRMIRLSSKMIDCIFVLSSDCVEKPCKDAVLLTCKEALGLCLDLLRSGTELLLDRLPALSNLFRKVVKLIILDGQTSNYVDEYELRILAVDIEK